MAGLRNSDASGRGPGSELLTLSGRKPQESALSLPAGRCYCLLCVRGVPGLPARPSNEKRVHHCTATEGLMTTATRSGHVLSGLSFGAIASIGLLALPVGSDPAMAQNHGAAALTGTVS